MHRTRNLYLVWFSRYSILPRLLHLKVFFPKRVCILGGQLSICKNGLIEKYHCYYDPSRVFPIDMAGFAIRVSKIQERQTKFSEFFKPGHLETEYLSKILEMRVHTNWEEYRQGSVVNEWTDKNMQGLGKDCRQILVWHTKTKQ